MLIRSRQSLNFYTFSAGCSRQISPHAHAIIDEQQKMLPLPSIPHIWSCLPSIPHIWSCRLEFSWFRMAPPVDSFSTPQVACMRRAPINASSTSIPSKTTMCMATRISVRMLNITEADHTDCSEERLSRCSVQILWYC
uniref:Uncharacterized protein n=1 Tax=Arundo donax TaxID=35708 RepID=A0A0A8YAD7_ARUDO